MRWNTGSEILPWNTRLGQFFSRVWHGHADQLAPGGELEETDQAFVLELDVPGVTKEDITIDITDRRLSVRGTRAEKDHSGVLHHSTRATGSFAYEFTLPAPVDDKAVTAALDDGVLTIRTPKANGAKTTRVAIK